MRVQRLVAGVGIALWSAACSAMHVSPDGLGQVLVFPHYTANGGNQTLFTIANRNDRGKALKLRFLEGMNAREVLNFNVYLGPRDSWTASVFAQQAEAVAYLVTPDLSCTVPAIQTSTTLPQLPNGLRILPFDVARYTGTHDDGGPDSLARTREGYFEVIEMGEVVDDIEQSLNDISVDGVGDGTPRIAGTPANCARIVSAWGPGGYWTTASSTDLRPPSGGLAGSVAIVDALQGTMLSYEPLVIDRFSSRIQHTHPASLEPDLSSAVSDAATGEIEVFVLGPGGPSASVEGGLLPPERAVDAVSALMMQDRLYNEYSTTASLGAASEWVVSFPTRKFYVDDALNSGQAIAPFRNTFRSNAQSRNATSAMPTVQRVPYLSPTLPEAGEAVDIRLGDRGGRTTHPTCNGVETCPVLGGNPVPHRLPALAWASNVISFDQPGDGASAILGSRLRMDIDTDAAGIASEGWLELVFDESGTSLEPRHSLVFDYVGGGEYFGLPALGFWALSVTNANVVPGVLANYSMAIPHRGSVRGTTFFRVGDSTRLEGH